VSKRYREPRDDTERYWQERAAEMGVELRYEVAEPGTHYLVFGGSFEPVEGEDEIEEES
jgi:hypothetical protein